MWLPVMRMMMTMMKIMMMMMMPKTGKTNAIAEAPLVWGGCWIVPMQTKDKSPRKFKLTENYA